MRKEDEAFFAGGRLSGSLSTTTRIQTPGLGWQCHHHLSCYWQGLGGRKFTLTNLLQPTLCFGYIVFSILCK
jgi:hypothetical protein